MKQVVITGPMACNVAERPDPVRAANFAVVSVQYAPMCTEFHQFRDGHVTDTIGHEAAGVVVEAPDISRIRTGDRVVVMPQNGCGKCPLCLAGEHIRCRQPIDPLTICDSLTGRATYAEKLIQQDWLLWPIPDDISTRHASMACCGLGPTFNACETMQVGPGDTLLISGLGPVGLGAVINGVIRGARVIGLESNPYRLALAKRLGASEVLNPADEKVVNGVLDLTEGQGADKAIEASSTETGPAVLYKSTRINGQMCTVGYGGPIRMPEFVTKGITLYGCWHWNHLKLGTRMAWALRQSKDLLDTFITHEFALSEVEQAWKLQMTAQCGKVLLRASEG